MYISSRQRRIEADQLVEAYTECRVDRRVFLQRAMAVGLSLSAATSLLTACGGTHSDGDTSHFVDVMNVWSGEEQESFKAVVAPFSRSTGITVTLEVTRDLNDALAMRLLGSNPPDIAILPNPGKMQELASQNYLVPLNSFLNMNQIRRDYKQTWLDLGSYKGQLYALFYKAANKGTVWYNPVRFQKQAYAVPTTWDGLIALSDRIARGDEYPWALGVSSASSSGWPAADWVAEIYLRQSGPQMYDQWVKHQIPWVDESIRQAFKLFGRIISGKHYIAGAPHSILNTLFSSACYEPFTNPPQAYMDYLADFAPGFIKTQFPRARPGVDFNFFPFPTLNPQYADAVTGGADVVVVMHDRPSVRQLVQYMATAQAQEIWVKRGGFTSLNQSVDLSIYPDSVARASAQMLTQASIYRFGADDLMPFPVERAFWTGVQAFIKDQSQLDSILTTIEFAAQQAYPGS